MIWVYQEMVQQRTLGNQVWSFTLNTLFSEGARGSLSKYLIDNFDLSKDKDYFKICYWNKGVMGSKRGKPSEGLVEHSMGWPLSDGTGGGSFLYHFWPKSCINRICRTSQLYQSLCFSF